MFWKSLSKKTLHQALKNAFSKTIVPTKANAQIVSSDILIACIDFLFSRGQRFSLVLKASPLLHKW
jgi:hypothetical protein